MIYKNFRYHIVFRVLAIAASIYLMLFVISLKTYYVTPILLLALVIYQLYSLVLFVEKSNRDITQFLESIRYSDFTRTFQTEGLGSSFDDLKKAFNDVITDFQKIRTEKEEHFFYIQNIIRHIDIGIIAYAEDGSIEMINDAAKKLFQIYNLKNIKALKTWNSEIEATLNDIKTGENRLIKVSDKDELLQLSIFATEFRLNNRTIKLISIKNIQAELEEQEMEAWQKLIRVLTHEIMNSIAPIASLTATVNGMIADVSASMRQVLPDDQATETMDDIQYALETIHKRSTGLIHFVETYRNLTRIPKPNFTIFKIEQLVHNIHDLLHEELNKKGIGFEIEITPPGLQITADEQLIEQVIINLIKNSIHALEGRENPKITIRAYSDKRDHVVLQVHDNGCGILKDVLDKIFIPFFTTKPTGSGIGLSLSKQILRMHGGNISVTSESEKETCFTLSF
ncbi:MAG TPA: ATP-binding protein [Bacteroidales bacterium]|nr:ATP-binding protein [Bacteroidales bacterium]